MKFWKKIPRTPEERKKLKNEQLLLILSGLLLGLAFPPLPFPFQLLFFVGFIPYFIVIERRETLSEISRATYLTFFVFSVITLYWVGSWQPKADPFLMISGFLLLFVNPIFILIPSTLYYFCIKALNKKAALFLFPVFWITYEYLYMITDASFPWLTIGSGLSKFLIFIQAADIIGALGLSLLIIYINIFFYKSFINKENKVLSGKYAALGMLLFILPLIYGIYRMSSYELSDKKFRVGIVQPNLDPWEKWSGRPIDELVDEYLQLSKKAIDAGAELIVWPETALPVYLMGGSYQKSIDDILNFVTSNKVNLLTGMPDIIYYDDDDPLPYDVKKSDFGNYATYNAILLFQPGKIEFQRYGKIKLVPFGERVPFVDALPFLADWIRWGVGIGGWNVGQDTLVFNAKLQNSDTLKINGLVCYESLYPFFVAEFVNRGADLIAVVTNDSWYGKLSGPYQHKEISVLRAIENRKSVIRAANGGISCIINPLGITLKETDMLTKDVIAGDVVIQQDETIFTKTSMLLPTLSSAFSFWIFGIFILKKLKDKWKL